MKKIIPIIIVLVLVLIGGYYIYSQTIGKVSVITTNSTAISSPDRPAEITGYIISALGNEIKIAKEIGKVVLSEEEQAAKKAQMQNLSPEERTAARQDEAAKLTTEEITLIIPVGITIAKGSGDASGNVVSADIADLSKGVYVSIWIDTQSGIEYVKIKGI